MLSALVALAYYIAAQLGLELALVRDQVTPLWPPTGIAVAAILLFGRRVWPGIVLGAFAVNAPLGPSPLAAAGIAAGNTLAPLAATELLRRCRFRIEMDRLRDTLAFVFGGALMGMLVSATIGAAILLVSGALHPGSFLETWSVWWAGDAMGVLVFAPALLLVRSRTPATMTRARRVEAVIVLLGVGAAAILAITSVLPVMYLVLPPVIWAAWRFQQDGAAPAVLVASVITVIGAANGTGPFARMDLLERMTTLQAFNGTVALTAYLLAAMTLERISAGAALLRSGQELEQRVTERTGELAATIAQLESSERRLEEAQRVASIGSWEWDIAADSVTWTDELYRLHGLEPGSIAVTYQVYLDTVHPDDRQVVDDVVQTAYQTLEPFSMDYRIALSDGSVRWLHGRGNVVAGPDGTPVKMYGTGQDVTSSKGSERAIVASETRFRRLIASAPDAVVCVDHRGTIVLVNEQACMLFGYEEPDLLGRRLEDLLPERLREHHQHHRSAYVTNPRTRPMGAGLQLSAKRKDGSEFPVDISLSAIETPEGDVVTAFVRDVTERRRAEQTAIELRDAATRQRQAFEINDTIVQGLAAAVYALDSGDTRAASQAVQHTLQTARTMMANLVGEQTTLAPGDLARGTPATVAQPAQTPPSPEEEAAGEGLIRVVIADDTTDIRFVLRSALQLAHGFAIVGEAADGAEAVTLTEQLHPDILLLDLAMPVMDGLEALRMVARRVPATKVVVLSGFGKEQAAAQAIELGAAAYVEKGGSMARIAALLRELTPGKGSTGTLARPKAPPAAQQRHREEDLDLIAVYVHELRNPLTALMGLTETLTQRLDVLPDDRVREMHAAILRSATQLNALVDALADARRLGSQGLTLQPTDLAALAQEAAAEVRSRDPGRTITVQTDQGVTAPVDPPRIRQVLANLLSNAEKFSGTEAPIELRVRTDNGSVLIEVRDHGPGIPDDDRHKLFGKFERLGSTHRGVGLGLYTSRGIARAHGGDLLLADSGPHGSTFVLSLPRVKAATHAGAQA